MRLGLDFTRVCNSKCTTCEIWKLKNPISLDICYIEKLISQIDNLTSIYVSGGEPYIHPDILEIALIVKKYHPSCAWNGATNCVSKNTFQVIQTIKNIGINIAVELSLEGNEIEHDTIRGIVGNYNNVMYVLEQCKINNISTAVSTVTETGEIECKRLGIPYGRNFIRFGERYNTEGCGDKVFIPNCPGAKDIIICTPSGDIYPCEEYSKELYLGNIKTENLSDMRFADVIEYIFKDNCKPCSMGCYL